MNSDRIFKILLAPLVTEKGNLAQADHNQYLFKVATKATKPEIKAAVEKLFNVGVEKVTVLNVKPQRKTVGRIRGATKAWKKAYVKLTDGQTIDVAGVQA